MKQTHLTKNSFIHKSSRRAVILMSSRYDQVTTQTFQKIVHNIGMRWHKDFFIDNWRSIYSWGGVSTLKDMCWFYSFSFAKVFFPLGFPLQDLNEAIQRHLKVHKNTVLFFLHHWFLSHWVFPWQDFNEAYS